MFLEIENARYSKSDPKRIEFEILSEDASEPKFGFIIQRENSIKLIFQDAFLDDVYEEDCPTYDGYDYSIEDALDLIERELGISIEW